MAGAIWLGCVGEWSGARSFALFLSLPLVPLFLVSLFGVRGMCKRCARQGMYLRCARHPQSEIQQHTAESKKQQDRAEACQC